MLLASATDCRLRTLGQGAAESDCNATGCTDAGFNGGTGTSTCASRPSPSTRLLDQGAKLVIWISPGWPLLLGTGGSGQNHFASTATKCSQGSLLSPRKTAARINLRHRSLGYSRCRCSAILLYQSYLKGVSTAKNIEPEYSGASSIPAINSGGCWLLALAMTLPNFYRNASPILRAPTRFPSHRHLPSGTNIITCRYKSQSQA